MGDMSPDIRQTSIRGGIGRNCPRTQCGFPSGEYANGRPQALRHWGFAVSRWVEELVEILRMKVCA